MHAFVGTIFAHLASLERDKTLMPPPVPLKDQLDYTVDVRAAEIGWLALATDMVDEGDADHVFFRAVAYLDRYLAERRVRRNRVRVVSAVAFTIAAKYEDALYLSPRQIAQDHARGFPVAAVARAEVIMARDVLRHRFGTPTVADFLPYYLLASGADPVVSEIAWYGSYLTMMLPSAHVSPPSATAVSAIVFARGLAGLDVWPAELDAVSPYVRADPRVITGVDAMLAVHALSSDREPVLASIRFKFAEALASVYRISDERK